MFFTRLPPFQNHWMTGDKWAELINTHHQMPEAVCFNKQKLKNILMCCKWLNAIIESKRAV